MNLMQKIHSLFSPMLTCEKVNQFIIDYLEDELPAKTRKKFEAHLAKCEVCSAFFTQYKDTISLVKTDGQIDVPKDLSELTMSFLREHINENPASE